MSCVFKFSVNLAHEESLVFTRVFRQYLDPESEEPYKLLKGESVFGEGKFFLFKLTPTDSFRRICRSLAEMFS
jgi:hypothetical protein